MGYHKTPSHPGEESHPQVRPSEAGQGAVFQVVVEGSAYITLVSRSSHWSQALALFVVLALALTLRLIFDGDGFYR